MTHWDRLTRVTAPAGPALSLEAACAHLKVDSGFEDEVVEACVAAAIGAVDGPRGIGVCLVTQGWKLTLDRFERHIRIPIGPNVDVTAVEYIDADGVLQTVDVGDYQLAAGQDPAVLMPTFGTCWPTARCEPGAVRITFTAGFGADEAAVAAAAPDLVGALKLIVGDLYKNRDGDEGGGGVPRAAQAVLDRYACLGVA